VTIITYISNTVQDTILVRHAPKLASLRMKTDYIFYESCRYREVCWRLYLQCYLSPAVGAVQGCTNVVITGCE